MTNWKKEYYQAEVTCEKRFADLGTCWHLHTDGTKTGILFAVDQDYVFGMNLMGLCADRFRDKIRIYTFLLMSNHLHIIIGGSDDDCMDFFKLYINRLKRYLSPRKNGIRFTGFENPALVPITDLNTFRNEIVYVNRNAYVEDCFQLPFSYPWGSNGFFFNTFLVCATNRTKYNSLRDYQQYEMLSSRDVALSEQIEVMELHFIDNRCLEIMKCPERYAESSETIAIKRMILPSSFCYISQAESLFRDHHQYYNLVAREIEVHCLTSKRLADHTCLSDRDIYIKTMDFCKQKYDLTKISLLDRQQKIEIAKILKSEYYSSNSQIERTLNLDSEIINEMFPQPKRK